MELTSPCSPVPTIGRKEWTPGDAADVSTAADGTENQALAAENARAEKDHSSSGMGPSDADRQAPDALSASFAARRDVASAKQSETGRPPAQNRATTAHEASVGSPSAPRTIPGRSPVTRKHARGRRKPSPATAVSLSVTGGAKAAAALTTAPKVEPWIEARPHSELLGRGKIDANLPVRETIAPDPHLVLTSSSPHPHLILILTSASPQLHLILT